MKDAIAPVTLGLPHRPGSVLVPTNARGRPPSRTNGDGSGHRRAPEPSFPAAGAARLGMLVFLAAETMLFVGFVAAYLVFRLGAPVWPPPFQPRLPVEVTGVNTLILLASSLTLTRALRANRRGDRAALVRGLGQTALLGVIFLAVQGYEWARLVHFGLTVSSGAYGTTFYTLIGAHGIHVLAAVIWLSVVLVEAGRGRFTPRHHVGLSLCRMYWYFVVFLWPVLYTLVYLR